jgi:copper chaperone CopZ
VTRALEELQGVICVDVSFGERKATVAFDASSLTITDICQHLFNAGYFAKSLQSDSHLPPEGQKTHPERSKPENTDLICYCFGYSRQDIEDDFAKNGRSLIMEKIMAEKKAGACDCAIRNPKGR